MDFELSAEHYVTCAGVNDKLLAAGALRVGLSAL
jgi:hypothetical protein